MSGRRREGAVSVQAYVDAADKVELQKAGVVISEVIARAIKREALEIRLRRRKAQFK